MREYSTQIKASFQNGLQTDSDLARNSPFLSQCKYMKPTERGLRPPTRVVSPFDPEDPPVGSWPFPQIIRGKQVTLVAYATELEWVTEEAPYWTRAAITTYDVYDEATPKEITTGGTWQFIDFFNTWYLLNGVCIVSQTNEKGMFGETDKVLVNDTIVVSAGCDFRGRALFGGFDTGIDWDTVWNHYGTLPVTLDESMELGASFVLWTTPGGGDLPGLFDKLKAPYGVFTEDETASISDSLFADMWKRNEIGFMPMPWQGTIMHLKPLGNSVVAYGRQGMAILPALSGDLPGFGMEQINKLGISSRGAVGGDENHHLVVAIDGALYMVRRDTGITRLGYRDILAPMIGQEIMVIHNPQLDEFFISGSDEDDSPLAFLLTKAGLGEAPQQVTSAYYTEGDFLDDTTGEDTEVIIVSDDLDFNIRDIKMLTTVEIGTETAYDMHVAADWRMKKSDSYTRSSWKKVNNEGFARVQVSGVEFRVCLKIANYTGTEIDYVNAKWQLTGKRTVRGLRAEAPNT